MATLGTDVTDPLEAAVLVETDVGPLLFPAWDRVMLPALQQDGKWEPDERKWIEDHVVEGTLALDVGANGGYHAVTIARKVGPTGRVLALEPDPFNFQLLLANLRINAVANVCALNLAAGDKNGTVEFTRDPVNAGDHRTYRRAGSPPESVIRVPMVRIDDLRIGAEIAFVLIDTQSFDHRVVRGMERLVAIHRPAMMVEYWVEGLAELGDDPAAVISYYRSLGYEISVLDYPEFAPDSAPEAFVAAADAANGHYVSLVLSAE